MSTALDVAAPMPTWGFQRDDLPSSVHGLMSLWGGFDTSADVADNATCEKRFEADIAFSASGASLHHIDQRVWESVFSSVGESVLERQADESVHFYRSHSAALVVLRNKVVMSAAASVLLHQAVSPILDACTKGTRSSADGAVVEWASFMRKNLASPWDPDNDIQHAMAKEYAQLKHRFPQGKSYLIGPVDADHYFYFVHDAVDRQSGGVVEDDVQLNLVMYLPPSTAADDIHRCCSNNKVAQTCVPLGAKGEYELFRRFTTCGQSCVTFETNGASQDHAKRIGELLVEHQPERFTLITLFDPHTAVARRLATGDRCGLDKFAGYTTDNCCTNEFAHGYVVRKTMFVRSL